MFAWSSLTTETFRDQVERMLIFAYLGRAPFLPCIPKIGALSPPVNVTYMELHGR